MEKLWFTCTREDCPEKCFQFQEHGNDNIEGIKDAAQKILDIGYIPQSIIFGPFKDCAIFKAGTNQIEKVIEGISRTEREYVMAEEILKELDKVVQIDWNFEKFYIKAIEKGLKKFDTKKTDSTTKQNQSKELMN